MQGAGFVHRGEVVRRDSGAATVGEFVKAADMIDMGVCGDGDHRAA